MAGKKQLLMTAMAASFAAMGLPAAAQVLSNGNDAWRAALILPQQSERDYADASPVTMPPEDSAGRYVEAQILRKTNPPAKITKSEDKTEKQPVDLTADQLEHDDQAQTIIASGHVELVQAGRILRADKVVYYLSTDTVLAHGHVVVMDKNGDVHFADEVQLTQKMAKGFVKGLESYLANGGRFTAESGTEDGPVKKMKNAAYTPCECDGGKGKPAWQIKAKEIVYHEDTHRITGKGATFAFFGVPAIWTPFISVPDGKEKRKSGLLTPQVGYHSNLGAILTENYYWNIAPDRDATTGMMIMTQKSPVALATYRQRFDQALIHFSGSLTHSDWVDSIGEQDIDKGDRWRGHVFADGLWNIDEKWRAGANLELTSDDQYLREYEFSHKSVLENQLYVERFSGRDYARGRILAFQDVRVAQDRTNQPDVLPQIEVSMFGDPNGTLGGRWNFETSLLGLHRNGTGEDLDRLDGQLNWQRRFVTGFGLVNTLDLGARGDFYYIYNQEDDPLLPATADTGTAARFFPHAQLTTSYPFAKPFEKMQAVIEPVASITASSTNNVNNSRIPNEDSQDVGIDANNLFEYNRFPGLDRIEDGSHATYGLRTGLYGYDGSYGTVFFGQSHRLSTHDNPFPDGSGLQDRNSDVVGTITAGSRDKYGLNYRFQLDSQTLSSQRHEISGFANWDRFRFNTRYVFTKALAGTSIDFSREQTENNISYDITKHWRIRGGAINDFGEDPGLRRAVIGLDYFGCCMSFNLAAERNIASDASGDNGTSVSFRIGLKGLGGFDTPNKEDDKTDGLWRRIPGR